MTVALSRLLQKQQRHTEAVNLLEPLLPVLTQAISKSPEDLILRTGLSHARLALSRLRQTKAEAETQCAQVIQELAGQRRFLKLHFEITEAWVQAHSCLGREAAVEQENAWLKQRSPR